MNRRHFVSLTSLLALPAQAAESTWKPLGQLRTDAAAAPIPGATWYVTEATGSGMQYQFAPGTLAGMKCITADILLDGAVSAAFQIVLKEGEKGRAFRFGFGALNQCSLRLRLDLGMTDQGRWMADREGAFLKPACGGDRVDLEKVDRLSFTLSRKGPNPVRWCMTPLKWTKSMPEKLAAPVLPKGALLDRFGQTTLSDWPGKTIDETELKTRLRKVAAGSAKQSWPEGFSRWGGCKARKLGEPTGWFRTHHDGKRWWLADPDGYAFWSAGLDCVRVDTDARVDGLETALQWMPEGAEFKDAVYGTRDPRGGKTVNFLAANMIRAFGAGNWRDKWSELALSEMKRLRFNTVGNWSEWEYAAKGKFPYVRPLQFRGTRCGMLYRDFPDVFHTGFAADADEFAAQLQASAKDPALIGYFLMNEPTWAFSSELPATGMLYNTETCATRVAFAKWLHARYADDAALQKTWNTEATFARIERGKWRGVIPAEATNDLREFSLVMAERYFQTLSNACKQADPNHLNLGMRWQGVPKEWAVPGMKSFDVFSLNCYMDKLPQATTEKIASLLKMPVLVGEWHFGALDRGLPSSGIGRLKNQIERAKAYRVYLEDAAQNPHCVGVHWFTMYDQSALGRFDGENYNIGFFDVCQRAYDEMSAGAIASHERMYDVAAGKAAAYTADLEYLPKVFL